jgi:hypothetical protein
MTRFLTAVLGLLVVGCLAPVPTRADEEDWQTVSDVGAVSLLVLSVGIPAVEGDGDGVLQAVGTEVVTSLVVEGLKLTVSKERPDGSDDHSFPSGHTARSFAAATTMYERQGAGIGIPALVVAGIVGLARVEGQKHDWVDVIAGAAIGTASGLLLTQEPPDPEAAAFTPWVDGSGAGFSLALRF